MTLYIENIYESKVSEPVLDIRSGYTYSIKRIKQTEITNQIDLYLVILYTFLTTN